jgi:outer membrane protein
MKRLALALAMLGCGLAVSPFVASSLAAGAGTGGTKIAVIDIERTLYETPAGKRASEKFKKALEAKQAELDKQQQQFQKDAEDLKKQATMYKPEVLKTKQDELGKRYVDLQNLAAKLEHDLAGERATLIQELLKQAEPIIDDLAKQEGVDLIVDQSAVLFADKKLDLTEKLDARMK